MKARRRAARTVHTFKVEKRTQQLLSGGLGGRYNEHWILRDDGLEVAHAVTRTWGYRIARLLNKAEAGR